MSDVRVKLYSQPPVKKSLGKTVLHQLYRHKTIILLPTILLTCVYLDYNHTQTFKHYREVQQQQQEVSKQ